MADITKLLEHDDKGFKRCTGIHKATFFKMLNALKEYEQLKTKPRRPSALSLEEQILLSVQKNQKQYYNGKKKQHTL